MMVGFLSALQEGKKIRCKSWSERNYWYVKNDTIFNSQGEKVDDWEIVEDKTLSDKSHSAFGDEIIYYEKDVKEAIKEFIDWLRTEINNSSDISSKAAKIFGKRLIE